jgi:predicted metallo-beta-lactamase superfamily hydrolase
VREKDRVSKPKTLFFLRKNNPKEKAPSSKKLNEHIYKERREECDHRSHCIKRQQKRKAMTLVMASTERKRKEKESNDSKSHSLTNTMHKVALS